MAVQLRIKTFIYFLLAFVMLVILTSCQSNTPAHKETEEEEKENSKKALLDVNKKLVKNEDQRIADFIKRYRWKMETSGSGLRYQIDGNGNETKAQYGNLAEIDYSVGLLDGTQIYDSDQLGFKTIILGKSDAETGLQEGILMMKKGDRAKFIIPSHLAFGLLGDGNKIPARATLVYEIELIDLK